VKARVALIQEGVALKACARRRPPSDDDEYEKEKEREPMGDGRLACAVAERWEAPEASSLNSTRPPRRMLEPKMEASMPARSSVPLVLCAISPIKETIPRRQKSAEPLALKNVGAAVEPAGTDTSTAPRRRTTRK